ncbi:MAG: CheR family methyltransferase [Dehalococcoidia bacterium]
MTDEELLMLKRMIYKTTNIDLNYYKDRQMRRRLGSFVERSGEPDVRSFCQKLEHDKTLLEKLRNFLTINVSEFFRDAAQFEYLRDVILPELLHNNTRLNIWSAGCSRGTEPYSIAMLLEKLSPGHKHRILATDVDEGALAQAKAGGPYTEAEVRNVSASLLRKYFSRESESRFWIVDGLKTRVTFRKHDLLRDPYGHGFDMVICRNVIIYFTEEAKKSIGQKLANALKKDGVLFIGGSEVMFNCRDLGLVVIRPGFYRRCAMNNDGVSLGEPMLSY